MYLPEPIIVITGAADAEDDYILANGETELACRMTHILKALFT